MPPFPLTWNYLQNTLLSILGNQAYLQDLFYAEINIQALLGWSSNPANIYMSKVEIATIPKGVKYVQS